MDAIQWWFEQLDQVRRTQGNLLDSVGLGKEESRYQLVHGQRGVQLRHYSSETRGRPVLLIVPAPIKAPYVWDLEPSRSVVRWGVDRGFDVYLAEWTAADASTAKFGLEDYAGRLLADCMEVIRKRSEGARIFLAGHSLGGTFAALYSAWRPAEVAGLILAEAPLGFGSATGDFRWLLNTRIPANALLPGAHRLPGSALAAVASAASPRSFVTERFADLWYSQLAEQDLRHHCRAYRWTLDELPLPRALFNEVVERLYRQDAFMQGELEFQGAELRPSAITAPVCAIYDPRSQVVPPEAILPALEAISSEQKYSLSYRGDRGIALQHLGVLIGEYAHRHIWPEVFRWLRQLTH